MKKHYNQPMIQIVAIAQTCSLLTGSNISDNLSGNGLRGGGGNDGDARSRGFDFFDD